MHMVTIGDLASRHGKQLRRLLARRGLAGPDLDDAAQEVLWAAHEALPRFVPADAAHPERSLRNWFLAIGRRQAAKLRRARRRRRETLVEPRRHERAAPPCRGPESLFMAREAEGTVQSLLEYLPPERRAVIVGHVLMGVPMSDVAAAQGVPVNTAWNRLRLGIENLRAAWDETCRAKGTRPTSQNTRGSIPPRSPPK